MVIKRRAMQAAFTAPLLDAKKIAAAVENKVHKRAAHTPVKTLFHKFIPYWLHTAS